MNEKLQDFNIVEDIPIQWGDMDARGHVNNTVYFRYFESSRIALFHSLNVYEEMRASGDAPILVYTHCNFKAPVTYPDTIYVGAKITSIEDSKVRITHSMVSKNLNREIAEGEALVVWYNYRNQKKAIISEKLRKGMLDCIG